MMVGKSWARGPRLMSVALMSLFFIVTVMVAPREAAAQLSNAHFDSPYSTADLVPFAGTGLTPVDKWAAEMAVVVGADNGVSPIDGDQMVKMLNDGSSFTELKQRVGNIDGFTNAQIDTGLLKARYFACFNAPANAPAGATAEIALQFLNGSLGALGAPVVLGSGPIGNNPNDWAHIEMNGIAVPVGARGAEAIIRYNTASLTGPSGFVAAYTDKTHLEFSRIPEPASIALCVLCGIGVSLGIRPRRRSRQR